MPEFCTNSTDLPAPERPASQPFSTAPTLDRPPRVTDLRRRDARLHAEQIAGRARFLPRAERALILAVYEQGRTISDLAALCGRSPRSLRRELRRILRRITSPEYAFVVVHRDNWSATMRRVAQSCIIDGVPVRRASQSLSLSLHTVRKHRDIIRLLSEGASSVALASTRSRAG